jgi:hypothetical protein
VLALRRAEEENSASELVRHPYRAAMRAVWCAGGLALLADDASFYGYICERCDAKRRKRVIGKRRRLKFWVRRRLRL